MSGLYVVDFGDHSSTGFTELPKWLNCSKAISFARRTGLSDSFALSPTAAWN